MTVVWRSESIVQAATTVGLGSGAAPQTDYAERQLLKTARGLLQLFVKLQYMILLLIYKF